MNKDRLILRLFALAEPTDFSGGFNYPQAIVIKPDVLPALRLMPPVTDYYVKIHCFAAYPVSGFDLALGKMVCPEKWWGERPREPKGRDGSPSRPAEVLLPKRTFRRNVPTYEFFRVFRLFRG